MTDKMQCPTCFKTMKKGYVVFECPNCGTLCNKEGQVVWSPKDKKPVIGEPK